MEEKTTNPGKKAKTGKGTPSRVQKLTEKKPMQNGERRAKKKKNKSIPKSPSATKRRINMPPPSQKNPGTTEPSLNHPK